VFIKFNDIIICGLLTGWNIDILGQLAIGILIQGDAALGAFLAQSIAGQIGLTVLRYAIGHANSSAVF